MSKMYVPPALLPILATWVLSQVVSGTLTLVTKGVTVNGEFTALRPELRGLNIMHLSKPRHDPVNC